MIEDFKEFTDELNDYERNELLPLFIRCLSNHVGKESAITNKTMCDSLLSHGYTSISGARVRKIINFIRRHNLVPRLCACGNGGYYVCNDIEEYAHYLVGLRARRNSIDEVLQMMLEHENMTEYDLDEYSQAV